MSREETQSIVEEILTTSQMLIELGSDEPSKLREELRLRRRALLARLEAQKGR